MKNKTATETSCTSVYKKKKIGSIFARIGIFLLVTVILIVGAVYAAGYVIFKGPSPTMQKLLTLTLRETSAMYWVPNLYMSADEVDALYGATGDEEATAPVTNVSLITISASAQGGAVSGETQTDVTTSVETDPTVDPDGDGIDIIEINSGTYKGYMAIIYDPSRIVVGTSREVKGASMYSGSGVELTELCAAYGAVLGINAGGFEDENGGGSGGIPIGIVIEEGEITYGSTRGTYSLIGFDYDGILHVGNMTGQQALDANMRWAVSFGPALIINGEPQSEHQNLVSGVNPRTAIGQRADGAVLMLVIDGRQLESLGATYDDLIDIMLEFGAVNAANLDGGSSTMIVYNGDILNSCASVYGPRPLPTSFLVMPVDQSGE